MGIADLWSILSPGFSPRQTLPVFVSRFVALHGRPPRLAIDAYIFLFLSGSNALDAQSLEDDLVIRNFMAKLLYLTSLSVSYVVVFDGRFKPNKIRNGALAEDYDYDRELRNFRLAHYDHSPGDKLPEMIIERLVDSRIEYVIAPAEAEAECAMLQRCGAVDYVVTNDVDALAFGATNVLRNFNRYREDIFFSPTKKAPQDKEYLVTPVDMDNIHEHTGLDRKRLVLIATLMGGDYSSGTHRLGLQNAVKVALCGTPRAAYFTLSPAKLKNKTKGPPLPDYAASLVSCFTDHSIAAVFDHWNRIRLADDRRKRIAHFSNQLNSAISERSRDVFGRHVSLPYGVLVEEAYVLLYLFPIVGPRVFKFLPGALSNCESAQSCLDLTPVALSLAEVANTHRPSHRNTKKSWMELVPRSNSLESDVTIGILCVTFEALEDGVVVGSSTYESNIQSGQTTPYCVPHDFRFRLRSILLRIIHQARWTPSVRSSVSLTRQKTINDEIFCMVKFLPIALLATLFGETQETINDSQPASQTEKPEMMWLPRNLIQLANLRMLEEFDEVYNPTKTSPPKKTQITTLSALGMNVSDPATSPRKRKKKQNAGPNQPLVTSFFVRSPSPEVQEDPFVDNRPEAEFTLRFPDNFSQMKSVVSSVPDLSCQKRRSSSSSSLPKRVRAASAVPIEESPGSSPVKPSGPDHAHEFEIPSSSQRMSPFSSGTGLQAGELIEVASHSESESDDAHIVLPKTRSNKLCSILKLSQEGY